MTSLLWEHPSEWRMSEALIPSRQLGQIALGTAPMHMYCMLYMRAGCYFIRFKFLQEARWKKKFSCSQLLYISVFLVFFTRVYATCSRGRQQLSTVRCLGGPSTKHYLANELASWYKGFRHSSHRGVFPKRWRHHSILTFYMLRLSSMSVPKQWINQKTPEAGQALQASVFSSRLTWHNVRHSLGKYSLKHLFIGDPSFYFLFFT